MLSLDSIAIFAQVARSQSFTEAAHALGMPLSTVSRKVSELEDDMRIKLIDRSKRQIRLTEAGAMYADLCRKGLDTISYANRVMTDRHSETEGTVTITVPPNLIDVLFLDAIATFQTNFPKAHLRVFVSERMLDFVEDGVDISFRVARPQGPELIVRTLHCYRHRLLAAPSYLAANPPPKDVASLASHKLVGFGFQNRRPLSWTLSRQAETRVLEHMPSLSINDYGAIKSALIAGHGIGELPEPLCNEALRTGHLIEVLQDWKFPDIELYAVHAGKGSLSKLARAFLDTAAASISP